MISWIQNTFQKHFKVIFTVLLAVTIISFTDPFLVSSARASISSRFFLHWCAWPEHLVHRPLMDWKGELQVCMTNVHEYTCAGVHIGGLREPAHRG